MGYTRNPNYHFKTKTDTGIDTVPVGSNITVSDFDGLVKSFVKSSDSGLAVSSTIADADALGGLSEISGGGALTSSTPVLTVVSEAFEAFEVQVSISNYDVIYGYNIVVTGGTYNRIDDIITWTLPQVTGDTQHSISVIAIHDSKNDSNTSTSNITVKELPVTNDQSILYNSGSMTEFTNHTNTEVNSGKLIAVEGTSHIAISNVINQDVGDTDFNGLSSISVTRNYSNLLESSESSVNTIVIKNREVLSTDKLRIASSTVDYTDLQLNGTILSTSGVTGANLTSISHSGTSTAIGYGESIGEFIFFDSGNKIMQWAYGGNTCKVYTLSSPYNITSTLTLHKNATLPVVSIVGATISKDGVHMYTGNHGSSVYHLTLSTPFDPTTATLTESIENGSMGNATQGTWVSPNGDYIFIYSRSTDYMYKVATTTPYYFSGGTITNKTFINGNRYGTRFSDDGMAIFFNNMTGDVLEQFSLSSPWDIQSMSNSPNYSQSYSTMLTSSMGLDFNEDGTIGFINAYNGDWYYQFNINGGNGIFSSTVHTIDASSVLSGSTPTIAYHSPDEDSVSFNFGNGYHDAVVNNVTYNSSRSSYSSTIESVELFDDIFDEVGGRTLSTKVTLTTVSDSMIELSANVSKKV